MYVDCRVIFFLLRICEILTNKLDTTCNSPKIEHTYEQTIITYIFMQIENWSDGHWR